MSPKRQNNAYITWSFAGLCSVVFLWWIIKVPPYSIPERLSGMDNRPKIVERPDSVIIGQFFDSLGSPDAQADGDWPRFRGPDFDDISKDTTAIAQKWDTSGPQILWRTTLGEGYAGPAVHNGKVYLMDYNERKKADALRCFSLSTGRELWRRWYYVNLKRNHGYSRTIPAITDKYLVSIGPRSHVMCLDPVSGKLLWSINLEKKFGIPGREKGRVTPDFYTGQCPLIDNDIVILAPGAKALMIGVDCKSGKIIWETPNPDSLRMSHGSIMPMTLYGKRMYVYNAVGGVCGISAEKEDAGKLLWSTKEWSPATTAASPVYIGNNEIAVFGSYGAGAARIKISYDGNKYSASVTEQHKATDGIASDQQTPVIKDKFIWTVMPENSGALKKQLACYSISDLRTAVWTSGKENRFGRGLGPYVMSGNLLFLLDDDGKLYLFRMEKGSASLLSSHRVLRGVEAWAPMALAGKYLVLRDSRNLLCLNISKK